MDQSVRKLIEAGAIGDFETFSELFVPYESRIAEMIVRRGLNAAMRDDVYMDVYIGIFTRIGDFKSDAETFVEWVDRIGDNIVRSSTRRRRRASARERPAGAPGDFDATSSAAESSDASSRGFPIDDSDRALFLERLRYGLLRCEPRQQQILARHLVGWKNAETAREFGIQHDTVKVQLSKARAGVADFFEKHYGWPGDVTRAWLRYVQAEHAEDVIDNLSHLLENSR